MQSNANTNRLVLAFCFFISLVIGYDYYRWTYCEPQTAEKPAPAATGLPKIAAVDNRDLDAKLELGLANQLANGSWAVVVTLPAPRRQTAEHDAVLSSISSKDGALHSLARENVTQYQYVNTIDDVPPPWAAFFADENMHLLHQSGGLLAFFDLRDPKEPRLVYIQKFPYTESRDEFPADWTPSQIIARELTNTLQRWRMQTAHLNFKTSTD